MKEAVERSRGIESLENWSLLTCKLAINERYENFILFFC